jgi:hypothetical protein
LKKQISLFNKNKKDENSKICFSAEFIATMMLTSCTSGIINEVTIG